MATPIWITGFEYGLATPVITGTGLADTVSGGVTIQATTKRTGGYALKCASTGTASYLQKTLTSSNYHVGSVYVYFKDALPNADNIIIRGVNTDGDMCVYFESSDSKLYAGKAAVSFCATGYTVTYNTWYRIDYRFYTAATTHTADWQVNGVAQTAYSVGSRSSNQMTAARLGNDAVTSDTYFDDVVISSATADYPIGAHGVEGLRPNVDGTHNNAANIMEDSAGNDIHAVNFPAFGYLDESPWVSTYNSDYVRQTANGTGNYCEINFADTTQTTILGAAALLQYASASDLACTGGCTITNEDATVTTLWGAVGALASYRTAGVSYYKSVIQPNPAGAWDTAAVNALKCRFGYSDDANPDPYWLAIMLEVAYSENTTLTVSPAAFTHAATTPTLVQQHTLAGVAACAFTHAATAPVLNELRTLTGVAACALGHATVNVIVVPGVLDTPLTVGSCAFTHAATTPTLVELRTLAVQSDALGHAATTPTLIELRTLTGVAACAVAHASTTPTPIENRTLAVASCAIAHAADNVPTLVQNTTLAVASCAFTLAAEVPALVELRTLTGVAACAFVHATVNVTLVPNVADTALTVAPCAFTHASTTPTIAVTHNLLVDSCAIASAATAPALNELRTLAGVSACAIAHAAVNVTLDATLSLAISPCAVALASSTPTLVELRTLAVANCTVSHAASTPTLNELRTLAVNNAAFTEASSTPTIAVTHNLVVDYALLGHIADAFALKQQHRLGMQDSALSSSASNVTLFAPLSDALTIQAAIIALEAQDIMMLDTTEAALVPVCLMPRHLVCDVDPRQYYFDSRERAYIIDVEPRLRP